MPSSHSTAPRGNTATARVLSAIGWVATVSMVLGPLLAWQRLVPGIVGFLMFVAGGGWAAVAALLGVIAAARGFGLRAGVIVGLVASAIFVATVARNVASPEHRGAPRINDFTTDPADPPTFRAATTLPPNRGRDMTYPREYWPEQAACCDDLRPILLSRPAPDALKLVEEVARRMPGWTVIDVNPESGTLEAVAETQLFGFQDDVIVRVRPGEVAGSRVDVRSKSRDGKGDLGTNAERIRAFTTTLRARAGQSSS
jgi:uncharacterized protein (DUF1499 family)